MSRGLRVKERGCLQAQVCNKAMRHSQSSDSICLESAMKTIRSTEAWLLEDARQVMLTKGQRTKESNAPEDSGSALTINRKPRIETKT